MCTSKALFKSLFQALFCLSFIVIPDTCLGGSMEGVAWTLGTKHIYLIGDFHHRGRYAQQKQHLCDVLAALKQVQEERDGASLYILLEKHSSKARAFGKDFHKNVLMDLKDEVESAQIPGVTVEDAEIRLDGNSLSCLLEKSKETDWNVESFRNRKLYEHGHTFGDITFQHILNEYEEWMPIFKEFMSKNQKDDIKKMDFSDELEYLAFSYDCFCDFLKENNINKEDRPIDKLEHWLSKDASKVDYFRNSILGYINALSNNLFDLYLFKRLIEYEGDHLAIFAGNGHCWRLSNFLTCMDAEEQVRYTIKETHYIPVQHMYVPPRMLSQSELISILRGYAFQAYITKKLVKLVKGGSSLLSLALYGTEDPDEDQ